MRNPRKSLAVRFAYSIFIPLTDRILAFTERFPNEACPELRSPGQDGGRPTSTAPLNTLFYLLGIVALGATVALGIIYFIAVFNGMTQ